jgi:hypothetical protein
MTYCTCSFCGTSGHTRRTCPAYRKSRETKRKRCETCSDLSHRRTQPKCLECGGPYVPERMPTLEDLAKQPRPAVREVIFGW